MRTPASFDPLASSSFATRIAFGTPLLSVSYVSTRSTQESGKVVAYARKLSISVGKDMTQLWAWVPVTGSPKHLPARRWLVVSTPPTAAARVAESAPSEP